MKDSIHHEDPLAIPACLRVDAAEQLRRNALWKGRRLRPTREMTFSAPTDRADKDPGTKRLLEELAAKARADEKAKRESRKEARLIKARQRAKPPAVSEGQQAHNPEGETTMKTATSKTDQVAAPRVSRANRKGPKVRKARVASARKADRAKAAPKARKARVAGAPRGIRPGSKLEIVVGLLTRAAGCTTAEALAATGWPAISFNQQAKAASLALRKVKEGKVTRYFAA